MRYKLTLEYDGSGFVGWQRQTNGLSVQGVIEAAVTGFCGEAVRLFGAGRTDAGVHARGQCAHLDLAGDPAPNTVRDALNAHLRPHAVSVLKAEIAAPDFDARRSAILRHYRYRIVNRRSPLALEALRTWQVAVPLDAEAMGEAAAELVGEHDFSTFRAAECQAASPVRTLDALTVSRVGEEIRIEARARSFLHNQIRIIAGSLVPVGEGKSSSRNLADALAACDRARAGPTAPPHGLYLMAVDYP
jgi:tRNA pseudouridine38-40 synthase